MLSLAMVLPWKTRFDGSAMVSVLLVIDCSRWLARTADSDDGHGRWTRTMDPDDLPGRLTRMADSDD